MSDFETQNQPEIDPYFSRNANPELTASPNPKPAGSSDPATPPADGVEPAPKKRWFDFFTRFWKQHSGALALLLLLVAVITAGSAAYFYRQFSALKADPQKVANEENQALVARVGKLIRLPQDEQPTIATVADLTQIKDQPFFRSASIGDKVLIYANAKKAILYNPTDNIIVEVSPINTEGIAGASTK